jgi:DNA-binding HxlR family transcriptional regulator
MAKSSKPIMQVLDLLGRRWVLRIVWELRSDALGFRELQRRCGDLSPSVLSQRLGDLKKAGIVHTGATGEYVLTKDGARLLKALKPLNEWAEHWRGTKAKK